MFRLICLAAALLAWSTSPAQAATEPWRVASSDHFVIYAQYSEEALRSYATELERFDKAMRVLRRLPDAPIGVANRLTVFVAANGSTVARLADAPASGIVGFYQSRAGNSIAVTSREQAKRWYEMTPQVVLLHEYAHHFMLRYFPAAYPAWFREGFAEFYSTTRFLPDGSVEIGAPANHRAAELALDYRPNFSEMLADGAVSTQDLYGFGWLLTHYLTFDEARKGQLSAYLDRINRGVPSKKAAVEAFGDLRQLERDLLTYRAHGRLKTARISSGELTIGEIQTQTLDPVEASLLPLSIRVALADPDKPQRSLASEAQRLASQGPRNAHVLAMIAAADLAAGQFEEPGKIADELLAGNPASSAGMIIGAQAFLARAGAATSIDERVRLAHEARKRALAANRVDANDPVPLILFYCSFAVAVEKPTANAVQGLRNAHLLAPEDGKLRLLLAKQMIADGKPVDARTLMTPLAYDLHAGPLRVEATALLAQLAATGATQASSGRVGDGSS